MVELKTEIGIRSFASVQVIRGGEVIQELTDCGNDLLDSWFTKWGTGYVAQMLELGKLRLGSDGGPTVLSMTTLINNVALKNTTTYGIGSTSANVRKTTPLVEGGKNYLLYEITQRYAYDLGAWVGTLRELGMDCTNNTANTAKTVNTRIVLPVDVIVTDEDQLIINYKWVVKILNEISTEVIPAMYGGVPTDVTITHTPGIIGDAQGIIDNHWNNNAQNVVYINRVSAGALNAGFTNDSNTFSAPSTPVVKSYDAVNRALISSLVITADKLNNPDNEIRHLVLDHMNHHSKWSFSPAIPKSNKHVVKMNFVTKVVQL